MKEFFRNLLRMPEPQRHYVGEWHSHPDGPPFPSRRDDESQAGIANEPATNCPEVILIIVGGNLQKNPAIAVFVYSRQHGRIDLLPVVT
jgi:proteasome lid subunit RPN8/RPN11